MMMTFNKSPYGWLLRGACSKRFYSIFQSVLELLENKDPNLKEDLIYLKAEIAYLTGSLKKISNINL